jgi:hypothetical protein
MLLQWSSPTNHRSVFVSDDHALVRRPGELRTSVSRRPTIQTSGIGPNATALHSRRLSNLFKQIIVDDGQSCKRTRAILCDVNRVAGSTVPGTSRRPKWVKSKSSRTFATWRSIAHTMRVTRRPACYSRASSWRMPLFALGSPVLRPVFLVYMPSPLPAQRLEVLLRSFFVPTAEARSSAQRAGHRRLGAVIVERQLGQRLARGIARGRDLDLFG